MGVTELSGESAAMRYKLFGKSGLRVSELCLGTMTFGEEWGWGASKEESRRMFDAYVNAGGTFIDTANGYTNGTSERYVGEFISQDRDRFVLATKFTFGGKSNNPNGGGNHRKSMVQALNASLKRLNVDYVDIYWVHAWDQITPPGGIDAWAGRRGEGGQGALCGFFGRALLDRGQGQHPGGRERLDRLQWHPDPIQFGGEDTGERAPSHGQEP
jgi:hypothetical protein